MAALARRRGGLAGLILVHASTTRGALGEGSAATLVVVRSLGAVDAGYLLRLILVLARAAHGDHCRSVGRHVLPNCSVAATRLLRQRLVLPRPARSASDRSGTAAEFPRLAGQANGLFRVRLILSRNTCVAAITVRFATFSSNTSCATNAVELGRAVNATRVENKPRAEADCATPLNNSRVRDGHVFNNVASTVHRSVGGVGDGVRHNGSGIGHRVDQSKIAQV